jgi:hypothetical protein
MIYKNVEEALNLNNFEPHNRPFLKNIFLEKYPNTVALHSLDAGDVSKTLGYTSLRLIPGETCMPDFNVITAFIINNESETNCRLHNCTLYKLKFNRNNLLQFKYIFSINVSRLK